MSTESTRTQGVGAGFLLMAASVVVVVAGLRAAAPLILPFLIAVFLAVISLPLLGWLQKKKVPTVVAVGCTVLVAVAMLAGLVLLVGRSLNEFTLAAPRYQDRLRESFRATLVWLQQRGIQTESWESLAFLNPGAVMDVVGSTLGAVTTVLSNLFLVVLTLIFILLEAAGFPRKLQAAFGDHRETLERFEAVTRQIQRYLGVKALTSLATGVLIGIWVATMGLGVPLLWGLVAFIFNFIPTLGSIFAAIPPVLLALVRFGPTHASILALGYLGINLLISNFIEPHLLGRRLGLSTLVVFFSLVFWGWVWGPVGMLLSVPLTVVVKIALEHTEDLRWMALLLGPNPKGHRPAQAASHPSPRS